MKTFRHISGQTATSGALLLAAAATGLLNSCRSDSVSATLELGGEISPTSSLAQLVQPVRFTAIEANDSCLLRHVSKVIASPSGYILLDRTVSNQIVGFDHDGRFVRNYGHKGSGPGEYASVSDIALAPDREVVLACVSPSVITAYQLDSEAYTTTTVSDRVPLTAITATGRAVGMCAEHIAGDADRLYVYSPSLQPEGEYIPCRGGFTAPVCPSLRSAGDDIYYLDWYDNALYRYDSRERCVADSISLNIPGNLRSAHITDAMDFIGEQPELGFILDWGVTADRLVVQYVIRGEQRLMIYDTQSRTVLSDGKYAGILPGLHSGPDSDTFLSVITYDTFPFYQEQLPDPTLLPPFDPDSTNAIIMEWKILNL